MHLAREDGVLELSDGGGAEERKEHPIYFADSVFVA